MFRIRLLITFTLIVLLLLPITPVSASSHRLAANIEAVTPLLDGILYGTFNINGPAVDAGILCSSGEVEDTSLMRIVGYQSPTGMNFQVTKRFICADGSGDFLVKLQVRLDGKGDQFFWVIMGGTGSYERLRGAGSGTGIVIDNIVYDSYEGVVHID